MPANPSKIEVINQALLECGANMIAALDEDSVEADVARALYDTTVQALMTEGNFRFCTKFATLARLAEDPPENSSWQYAYALPPDMILVRGLGERNVGAASYEGMYQSRGYVTAHYELMEGQLWANEEPLDLEYYVQADESVWPPYFTDAAVYALASKFAMPLTEDRVKAEDMAAMAKRKARLASARDLAQRPERPIPLSTLLHVRLG